MAWASLQRSMAALPFGRAVLFTHAWQPETAVAGLEVVDVGPIDSAAAYSQFVMRGLQAHIATPFVLVTQWDGFVIDAGAWRDEFLQYDYIGAPWADQPAALSVGNGGFSLRSQRFLRAGQDRRIVDVHPEDEVLCRTWRTLLTGEYGLRFAPPAVAARFAFENTRPSGPTLGFHGPYHLPRFLDAPTLGAWLAALPDGFFRSRDARRLARALLRARMPGVAQQLIQRRLAAGRRDPKTRVLGWLAGGMARFGARR
ncbi:MAG: hypothetical protein C0505_02670 [Leptothrix sp. (in: Bacteria)]|nr:hypothetical protein [Leptothrix sp. (in: b-proteobacteria)]